MIYTLLIKECKRKTKNYKFRMHCLLINYKKLIDSKVLKIHKIKISIHMYHMFNKIQRILSRNMNTVDR